MKRKIISLLLALVLLVSAMPAAFAAGSSFTDIPDEDVAMAAETLRLLGVVDGMSDGKFVPNGTLTRAQFCKMAVVMRGDEGQEPTYRSRTIFSDVASGHWARGYINLAASGENAFISGMGNGLFAPDENITFAQAVTILVRLLGYSDADTGMQWPEGYINLADSIGLTEGIDLAAGAAITRGQAAELFCAMLNCYTKSGSVYLSRFGTVAEKVIILDNDAVAADGSGGAVFTSAGTFKTSVALDDSYVGERGTLVSDKGSLVVFVPGNDSKVTVSASVIEAGWFKDSEGNRHTVPAATVVYTSEAKKTWSELWLDMPIGSNITIYYDAKGSIEALFYATSAANDNVAVAMNEVKGNPFTSLLDVPADCEIYKNGAPATAADIRRYDVAEYDKAAGQLRINDMRLSGCYENAYPSNASPNQIKVMGHVWDVLPSAQESLAAFKIGDMMTLLFTADMCVAGAVPPSAASGNAVGVVKKCSESGAEVELFTSARSGVTVSGLPSGNLNLLGELVTVSGATNGKIYMHSLRDNLQANKIDIDAMTFGSTPISPAVRVFDRVGSSMPVSVSLDDLPRNIARAEVLYARLDYAGRVDMLVLNDVTGDCYTYGQAQISSVKSFDGEGNEVKKSVLTVKSKGSSVSFESYPVNVMRHNAFGGVVADISGKRVLSAVALSRLNKVGRSDFKTVGDEVFLTVNGITYPVADDVQCYNAAAGEWFNTLDDARSFASVLTAYYDRDPADGGKIRIVVAE